MSQSVKQCCGGWLILCAAFFAGASAGSIGYDLGRGACVSHTIEGLLGLVSALQSSRPHALSDQRTGKQVDRRGLPLLNLDWAGWMVDGPGVKTNPNGRIAYRQLRADDGEYRVLDFEQIADPDLDLPLFVTQRHEFFSLMDGVYLNESNASPCSIAGRPTGEIQECWQSASPDSEISTVPSFRLMSISTIIFATSPHAFSMGQIPASAAQFGSIFYPRPVLVSLLASRVIRSAPADLLLAGWRDRPHVPLRHLSDPSWYSEENVKQLLDDKPQAVNKLLVWIFKPNRLTRSQREWIAMDLELIPTVPAHLELVQRSTKQRRQSRKEAAA